MIPRVLVLAGTAEARALCEILAPAADMRVIASLAGVTGEPAPYPVQTRRGGFGGAQGLAAFLREHDIRAVIDATHPFAAQVSAHAAAASASAGVPRLRLERPGWTPAPADRWTHHADLDALLQALPSGARVFAALGTRAAAALAKRPDVFFLLRVVEPPAGMAANQTILEGGPATVAAEQALLVEHAITHLAVRASGGRAGETKLIAARALGLPVHLIERPAPPPGTALCATPAAAAVWVRRTLCLAPCAGG